MEIEHKNQNNNNIEDLRDLFEIDFVYENNPIKRTFNEPDLEDKQSLLENLKLKIINISECELKKNSNQIVSISFDTKYTKNILAKNAAGRITDYQVNVITKFTIQKENDSENFSINEKFNFKKMTDMYEEKNYERTIRKNLANSISQKLILKLAVN